MFFLRAEKAGMLCIINTAQIAVIFAPTGQQSTNKCKAALDDGTTAEILTPFSELEEIIEAAHAARFAEAHKFLKQYSRGKKC